MKKVLIIVLLLFCLILTGCESNEKTVDDLFSKIKSDGIIDKSFKKIDSVDEYKYSNNFCSNIIYYIYENDDGELIAIRYQTHYSSTLPYNYTIDIYDVEATNKIEYIDDDSCNEFTKFKYDNNKISLENKYNIIKDSIKTYYAYDKKFLLWKYYDIEESNE